MVDEAESGRSWPEASALIQRELRQLREAFDATWAVAWGPIPFDARAPFVCVLFEDRDPVRAPASALGLAVPLVGNAWAQAVLKTGGVVDEARDDTRMALHAGLLADKSIRAVASGADLRGEEVWGVVEVYSPRPLRPVPDAAGVLREAARRVAETVRALPRRTPVPTPPTRDTMAAAALHDMKSALAAQTLLVASFEKELRQAAQARPVDPARLGAMLETVGVLRESVAHANELARVMTLATLAPGARVSIDLPGVTRLALAAVTPDLRERFTVEVDRGLAELGVVPSASALLRAIHNLVLNAAIAIQRVSDARAWVRLRPEGDEVLIEVEDEGRGVPLEVLDRLFQAGTTTRDHPEGHGYGLWSTRSIVESLGGRVSLHSVPGRGARFTIHLPRRASGR